MEHSKDSVPGTVALDRGGPAPGAGYPLLVLAAPRLVPRTGSGYVRAHWLLVWEVSSAAARTRSGYPTPSARLGSGRRYRVPMDSCGVLGRRYRAWTLSSGVLGHRYRGRTSPSSILRHRYRVPMASCDLPAGEYRRRTRPSRVSDRHDRAWTARHAVPIAPSARGRVPDSRSCGELRVSQTRSQCTLTYPEPVRAARRGAARTGSGCPTPGAGAPRAGACGRRCSSWRTRWRPA